MYHMASSSNDSHRTAITGGTVHDSRVIADGAGYNVASGLVLACSQYDLHFDYNSTNSYYFYLCYCDFCC